MTKTMTMDKIFEKVVMVIGTALSLEPESITGPSTLQGDLQVEGIYFLDILFRLEKEFDIKIPKDELFPEGVYIGTLHLSGFKVDTIVNYIADKLRVPE